MMQSNNKRINIIPWFLIFVLGNLAFCSSSPLEQENPFRLKVERAPDKIKQNSTQMKIFFSGNLNGELGQCGCSVNPKGGVERRLNFLNKSRSKEQPSFVFDAGNSLFAGSLLDPGLMEKQKEAARNILKAQKVMGVQAQNVGAFDLAAGLIFLSSEAKKNKISLLSTNLIYSKSEKKGQSPFARSLDFKVDERLSIRVFGLIGIIENLVPELKRLDPIEVLMDELKNLPEGYLPIVLSDLGNLYDAELAKKIEVPMLIIGGRDLNSLDIPLAVEKSLIVQTQIQGQQWGVFELNAGKTFDSWFNLELSESFARRWDSLKKQYVYVKKQAQSEDRKNELKKIDESAEELLKYRKSRGNSQIAYSYRLVDMDESWTGKNQLTALQKKKL